MAIWAWVLTAFVGVASFANAGSSGCYWQESKEAGGEKFRICVVCGMISAGIGFGILYSFLLMHIAPRFVLGLISLVREYLKSNVNSADAMVAFIRFRDARIVPWLVFFSIFPIAYRVWFIIRAKEWEISQIMHDVGDAANEIYYHTRVGLPLPRRRTPFQAKNRIAPTHAFVSNMGGGKSGGGGSSGARSSSGSKSSSSRDSDSLQAIVFIVAAVIILSALVLGMLTAYGIVRWADDRYDAFREMEKKTAENPEALPTQGQ